MANTVKDPNKVLANPSKDFFISRLIKDITLRDAIGDLVDNAVDAIKEKVKNASDLNGYKIIVKLNKDEFSISDNGLGMEAEIARTYAFNFGKNPKRTLMSNSIGQFGIGMKRAFFKIGAHIHMKSIAPSSQFNLTIDVAKWQEDPENWTFEFDPETLKENISNMEKSTGVHVIITKLSNDALTSFSDKAFIDRLQKEIALEHMLNINKGLIIEINDFTLNSKQITIVSDENIKPTYWESITDDLTVKIMAGISTKDGDDGGWYIFCNDRLVLAKDQTAETVWTGAKGDGVPKYHAQYHRFRGYVFFEASDSSRLPWNTTKTGMDMDSPLYKRVRQQMITMTNQVMDLLDKLKEERTNNNPDENQTLNKAVADSLEHPAPVLDVAKDTTVLANKFVYPAVLYNPLKRTNAVKITYSVTPEKLEAVKQRLKASTNTEIGLKTFNYYYDNEL